MILAVDPGGTTGVAIWRPHYGIFTALQVPNGRLGFFEWFDSCDWAAQSKVDLAIVCEDFIIGAHTLKKTLQVDPLRIIGYLEGWSHILDVPFKLQAPATGKGFGTDTKLKHVGWYTPGLPHATDAARHLLTYTRNRPEVTDLLRGFE